MDRQSQAYREATDADHWDDELETLPEGSIALHPINEQTIGTIKLPEDYETEEWDKDKDGPKTDIQATLSILDRIKDNGAPDEIRDIEAYLHEST